MAKKIKKKSKKSKTYFNEIRLRNIDEALYEKIETNGAKEIRSAAEEVELFLTKNYK